MKTSAESYLAPPRLRLRGVFLRRTDWGGANMTGADLSGSDLSNANLANVNFDGAKLDGTVLRGADLTGALNLTQEQIAKAVIDEATKLPSHVDRSAMPGSAAP